MLEEIYNEFIRLKQDLSYGANLLTLGDKAALILAVIMILGVFLPWVSAEGFFTQTGLMGGGDLHLLMAVMVILQVKHVVDAHVHAAQNKPFLSLLPLKLKRISLSYLIIGMSSTICAIFILIYFGSQYETIKASVDIRAGFYLTTFAGLLICLCGCGRFMRR